MPTRHLWGGGSLQSRVFVKVVIWCQYTRFAVSSLLNLNSQVDILQCNIVSIELRQPVFGFSEELSLLEMQSWVSSALRWKLFTDDTKKGEGVYNKESSTGRALGYTCSDEDQ